MLGAVECLFMAVVMGPFDPDARVSDCNETLGFPRMGMTWLWRGTNAVAEELRPMRALWRRASIMAEGDFIAREDMAIELGLDVVGEDVTLGDRGTTLTDCAASESDVASLPSTEAVGVNGGVAGVIVGMSVAMGDFGACISSDD